MAFPSSKLATRIVQTYHLPSSYDTHPLKPRLILGPCDGVIRHAKPDDALVRENLRPSLLTPFGTWRTEIKKAHECAPEETRQVVVQRRI